MSKRTEITRIQIKKSTVSDLRKIGEYGESYDDIIHRLIGHYLNNPVPMGR